MSSKKYVVVPSKVLGAITSGYFTIEMTDADVKRFRASTPEEQEAYIKFNGKFHPTEVKINFLKGVTNLEEI